MAEVQELLAQARALGEALSRHPRVQKYLAARAELARDQGAQQLLDAYSQQVEHIRRLEAERKPIEVADKHKLVECEQRLAGNDALKRLLRTQTDYIELMDQIHRALDEPLAAASQPSGRA